MNARPDIWFPAKRFGWGWGLPCRWQGWVVLLVYFGLIAAGVKWIDAHAHQVGFVAYMILISAAFVWVCWRKGERPRWRWGGD